MKNIGFRSLANFILSLCLLLIFTKHSIASSFTEFKELENSYKQDLRTFQSIKNKVEILKSIIENNNSSYVQNSKNENYTCYDYFIDLTKQKQQLANALNIAKNEILNLSVDLVIKSNALDKIINTDPSTLKTDEERGQAAVLAVILLENVKLLLAQIEEFKVLLEVLAPVLTNFMITEDLIFINECVNGGNVTYNTATLNEDRINLTFKPTSAVVCNPDGVIDFDIFILTYSEISINWIYELAINEDSSTNAVILKSLEKYNLNMGSNSTSFSESCINKSKIVAEPSWKSKPDESQNIVPENEKAKNYLGKTKIYSI